jgi:anti-sigma factor RsiW
MPCEHYEQDLIEAAATGGALPNDAHHHVEACARCSAALAEEQTLFAAIDAGIHKIANAELPGSFLARVQADLSAQPARRGNLVPAWAVLCAAAALAAVVGLPSLSRRSHSTGVTSTVATSVAATQSPADRGTSPTIASSRNSRLFGVPRDHRSVNAYEVRDVEPEVLVPPGEEALLLRFYESALAEPHPLRTLAADDSPPKPLAIAQIDVTELKVDSLEQRNGFSR